MVIAPAAQRASAEPEVEKSAFAYQIDGLLVKQGLMQEQGVNVHFQTKTEKATWKAFLAPSVEAWVNDAPDSGQAKALLAAIARLRQETDQNPALPSATGELEPEYSIR